MSDKDHKEARRRRDASSPDEDEASGVGKRDRHSSHRHRKRRHRSLRSDDNDMPSDKGVVMGSPAENDMSDDDYKRKKEARRHRKESSPGDGSEADDVGRDAGRSSHRHRKRRHRSPRSDEDDVQSEKTVKRRTSRTDTARAEADVNGDDMDTAEDDMVVASAVVTKSRERTYGDSSSSRRGKNYEDEAGSNGKSKDTHDDMRERSYRSTSRGTFASNSRHADRDVGGAADGPRTVRELSSSRARRDDDTSRRDKDASYIDAYGRSVAGGGGGGSSYGKDKYKSRDVDIVAEERGSRRRRDDDEDRSQLTSTSYDSRGRLIRDPAERTNSFASQRNDEAAAADAAGSVVGGTARRNLGRNIMEDEHERRRYEHYGNERTPERWHKDRNDAESSSRRRSTSRRGGDDRRDNNGDEKRSSKERAGRSDADEKPKKSRSPRGGGGSRKERTPDSPILNEEERDQRTVFVMQLSQRVTAWDLEEFFSAVGEIRDVRLIVDGRTKRSKGIAYIEFRDLESVPLAIGLNAQKLRGVPIKVQASHAERNRAAEAAAALMVAATFGTGGDGSPAAVMPPISASTAAAIAEAHGPPGVSSLTLGGGRPYIPRHLRKQQALEAATKAALSAKDGNTDKPMRVYVGSLHFSITEDDLRAIFEPFGALNVVSLVREPQTGRSRGYAFLTYKREEDARAAMNQMNGFDLAGRQIKVSHVNEKGPDNAGGGGGDANQTDRLEVEDGRGGISMTGTNRLALMAKLAEGTGLAIPDHLKATLDLQKQAQDQKAAAYQQIQQQKLQAQQEAKQAQQDSQAARAAQPSDVPEYATQCILLSNMFDPTQESGEEWHEEIRDDVISECLKHGGCVHAYVDRDSKEGNVYAKCPSVAMAVATVKAMNGRHYGGRVLQANYVPVAHYNALFADSVRATIRLQPRDAVEQQQ